MVEKVVCVAGFYTFAAKFKFHGTEVSTTRRQNCLPYINSS